MGPLSQIHEQKIVKVLVHGTWKADVSVGWPAQQKKLEEEWTSYGTKGVISYWVAKAAE